MPRAPGLPGIEVILRSAAFALQGEPAEEVAPEPAHLALWLGDKALSDDAVVQDVAGGRGPFSPRAGSFSFPAALSRPSLGNSTRLALVGARAVILI